MDATTMQNMAVMMAASMSREQLIDQLCKSIDDYKADSCDNNWHKLCFHSSLMMMKATLKEDGMEGAMEMMKDLEKVHKANMFFDTDEQKN